MYTIGQLARRFGLSRSTLLYYDSIGLLEATGRTASNYRSYSEEDLKRLEHICIYRQARVPLEDIKEILDGSENTMAAVLEKHLVILNRQIKQLRDQQHVIFQLLKNSELVKSLGVMNKETWITLSRAAGLDDEMMSNWHVQFERISPEGHQDFMESLGINPEEIGMIREQCRKHGGEEG